MSGRGYGDHMTSTPTTTTTDYPAPTPRYMSTLDDAADQVMFVAAQLVAADLASMELADLLADGIVDEETYIDPWKAHTLAVAKFDAIAPIRYPRACITDTEVRYSVMEVISEYLTDPDDAKEATS